MTLLDLFTHDPAPSTGASHDTRQTSRAAAIAIEPKRDTDRGRILAYIRSCGLTGATDLELQAALGLSGDTERPRRVELFNAGQIMQHGTRQTPGHRAAVVWIAKESDE